jgi:hypothetical protein
VVPPRLVRHADAEGGLEIGGRALPASNCPRLLWSAVMVNAAAGVDRDALLDFLNRRRFGAGVHYRGGSRVTATIASAISRMRQP